MAATILDQLPAWSRTIDPRERVSYDKLVPTALAFLELPPQARRELVKQYHQQYCFPKLNLEKASGLYLFFRVLFKLPSEQPRENAKAFGGWLHPSIGEKLPFDLSWPVKADASDGSLTIARFTGYSGKGYDALAEYDYLASQFPTREPSELRKLLIRR